MTRLLRPRTLGRNALHLLVLWTFAVAEPLFDLLGRTPEFFVVRGSKSTDVVVFALAIALVPPLALAAVEALVSLASARAASLVHLALVAVLAATVAVTIVRRDLHATALVFTLALALGVAFAALYARTSAVRMFMTVLVPAPLIFVAIFLARAPITKLEGTAKALTIPAPRRDVPVVLVVLDEFPVVSLMDPQHGVDVGRFPHFAALARTSTWYRGATSVHEHTTEAVPAILTGQLPQQGLLPLAKDHPDNLFTLLGKRYRMDVTESVTQLCPSKLCVRRTDSFGHRMSSLANDLEVVYGHLVLPKDLEDRLPSISNTWQGFGGDAHGDTAAAPARKPLLVKNAKDIDVNVGRTMWQDQRFAFERWVAGIDAGNRPTLHAIHALMPHYPWRYLPDGRQYGSSLGIDGLNVDTWSNDAWLVEQGWQRHLLQVGFTDRLLGELVAKLKRERIWDRALVIFTADHGSSFIPGERRRGITAGNIQDIAPVPLFVKYPRQRLGRVVDRGVETIDIVPTIADVIGVPIPYHVDGFSLLSGRSHGAVEVRNRAGGHVTASAATVAARKYETLRRQLALFDTGNWSSVYRIGPHSELIGRSVATLSVTNGEADVSIDGASLFAHVDLGSALSPGHVTGDVSGVTGPIDLAVAVNGRVAAVTRTFVVDGQTHFASFVPDSAFRQGANSVRVYAVQAGALVRLRGGAGAEQAYTLAATALRDGAGHTIRIVPGRLAGRVEDWYFERSTVRFGGWAGDPVAKTIPDAVVVFQGGRLVFAGATTVGRSGMFRLRPDGSPIKAGFVFELPRQLVGDGPGSKPLRFFAVRGRVATELPLPKGFPWAP